MPFWVLVDYILKRASLNSVNLQESSVGLTPFFMSIKSKNYDVRKFLKFRKSP